MEALISGGALEWQTDRRGRTPLDVARRAKPREQAAIVALLDRTFIADPSFHAAVDALHAGDTVALERLIEAEPRLLRDRILDPAAYRAAPRHGYFLDPKLFWFVANNPATVARVPANIVEVTQVMTARGIERADLDYALELTMSSSIAREQGHQFPLMRALLAAGAEPTPQALAVAAAYRELDALRALVADGLLVDAPLAAALGANDFLTDALSAGSANIQTAFGLAVINGNIEGARTLLNAGADVNAYLPVHAHSTALHQAAANDDAALVELLLAHGARLDARDELWDGTALKWAVHQGKRVAQAALERGSRRV